MTTKEGADWHRTVTVRLHLTDDPATNARIVDTGAQQGAVHKRTVEHLLRDRSDEPLQKSTARGQGRISSDKDVWCSINGLRIAGSAPRCQFSDLYNFENCAITVA